jgi:ribose/xylose/arabinose/galactoside ABC-type transport system permease subunit
MKASRFRHEIILLAVVAVLWLWFNASARSFGTADNTFNILRHSAEIGLLALVMTPVILTGGIDLSVGSLLGLCAVVFGILWQECGWPPWAAASGSVVLGTLAGGLNAALIAGMRLPPLIVTLGTFSLFRGLAEAITRGSATYTGFPETFLALGQGRWGGLPAQVWIFLGVAVLLCALVHGATWGRSLRAIGFSPEGSAHAGLPVARRIASVYLLAGLVAGIAGVIYTARLGQARADAGTGYELQAITAVVLGGTSIFGGTGTIPGTVLGVAAIAVLNNGLIHLRQPREMAGILTGLLLIGALTASGIAKALAARQATRHTPQSCSRPS